MRVRWLTEARKQYDSIKLSQESPMALTRLERAVNRALEQIEMFPQLAPRHPKSSRNRDDVRLIRIGNYRMGYAIDVAEDELIVFSFLHSGINPDSAFD
jgi:mRNA-degrading endonuclease RelE of RelBE toxin-antitoxin system